MLNAKLNKHSDGIDKMEKNEKKMSKNKQSSSGGVQMMP